MEETLLFEEIAGQEDSLLCDSSVLGLTGGRGWYYEDVYEARSFSCLNFELLKLQSISLEVAISLFEKQGVSTVREASLEIERARDLVSGNIRFLKRNNGTFRFVGRGEEKRELIEAIREMYHALYMAFRKSAFTPGEREKYSLLENITLGVTRETNAKVNFAERYEDKRAKPKNVPDYHTDEKLVAAALYLAIVEGKKGGILTRDGDIKRILENTLEYGGLNGVMDLIRDNRIRVYYVTDIGRAKVCFDSSRF